MLAGEGAAKTQTHSEKREKTYRGKERVKESDIKTERDRETKIYRKSQGAQCTWRRGQQKKKEAEGGGRDLDGLPCSDWSRLTAIKAHN